MYEEIADNVMATICDKYHSEYNKAISELADRIKVNPVEFAKCFNDFSDEYFMILPLWIIWSDETRYHHMRINSVREPVERDLAYIRHKGRSHFYYDLRNYFIEDSEFLKLTDFVSCKGHINCGCQDYHGTLLKNFKWAEKELSFPHSNLKSVLEVYDDASSVPVSKELNKMVDENMKLYDAIKSVEEDDEKWFSAVKEVKDVEFIAQNMEHRIAKDVCNKKLWQIYIEYLKSEDLIKMLEVYSNYVRFFIDDAGMIDKYRFKTEKLEFPQLLVYWKSPMDFERTLNEPKAFVHNTHPFVTQTHTLPKPSFDNLLQQNFSFRSPFMKYIFKTAKPQTLHKLYQTCKYIYSLFKTPICHRLVIGSENCDRSNFLDCDRQSMQIALDSLDDLPPLNLHISNSLLVTEYCGPRRFEEYAPYIAKSDIKYLTFNSQWVTMNDFNLLSKSGNIEELHIFSTRILKDENTAASIEEIMVMTPNIKVFHSFGCKNTPDSTQILNKLPFNNKIEMFNIFGVDEHFEPYAFCEFAKKNFAKDACVRITQRKSRDAAANNGPNFKTIVEEYFGDNMFFEFEFFER